VTLDGAFDERLFDGSGAVVIPSPSELTADILEASPGLPTALWTPATTTSAIYTDNDHTNYPHQITTPTLMAYNQKTLLIASSSSASLDEGLRAAVAGLVPHGR
jgi:hypothetical protein